ncbi:MAG TPA: hypothetical protein VMW08_00585 [Acidimicrobiales bacterium]|nr:hypothetical protein [Acidimicrobiales bacterium]
MTGPFRVVDGVGHVGDRAFPVWEVDDRTSQPWSPTLGFWIRWVNGWAALVRWPTVPTGDDRLDPPGERCVLERGAVGLVKQRRSVYDGEGPDAARVFTERWSRPPEIGLTAVEALAVLAETEGLEQPPWMEGRPFTG